LLGGGVTYQTAKEMTAKATAATGKRHCAKCRTHKFADAGREMVQADGKKRWVCNACLAARRTPRG
jgi:hypothetical protein